MDTVRAFFTKSGQWRSLRPLPPSCTHDICICIYLIYMIQYVCSICSILIYILIYTIYIVHIYTIYILIHTLILLYIYIYKTFFGRVFPRVLKISKQFHRRWLKWMQTNSWEPSFKFWVFWKIPRWNWTNKGKQAEDLKFLTNMIHGNVKTL